jgi:hypothetical protein
MGQKTRDEIITAGLQFAGNTSLSTLAQGWLNDWLRAIYSEGDWNFLRRDISGVALAAGTTSLTVGVGSGGITPEIRKILAPIGVYRSDYSYKGKAPLIQVDNNYDTLDERMMNTTLWRGAPTTFRVRMTAGTFGQWQLKPRPVPDRDYLLTFDYLEIPANLSTNTAPLYPGDETMVFAIAARAVLHMHGADSPKFQSFTAEVGAKVARDKGKYLVQDDGVFLDGAVFR